MGGQTANRRQYFALLAVILLAFALRTYDLGRKELWFDEAHSAGIAGLDWAGILKYTQGAPFEHPPLYYFALDSWTHFAGTSELVLRFFSVFWGVLLIPLLYRFTASWGGHRFGLLVAFVTAVSSKHVAFSQNARMYTLMMVLGVVLLICFFRGLASRRSRWWLAYLLTAGVGVAVHYYFALMLLVPLTFLALSGRRYRRFLIYLTVIQLGIVFLIASWLWFAPGPRQAILSTLAGDAGGLSGLVQRLRNTISGLFLEEPAIGHVALGVLAVIGTLIWPLPPPPRGHPVGLVGSRCTLLIWLLVPWLVALVIPYWLQDRHLAYVWPALYALIACGLLVLRAGGKVLSWAGLLLLILTSGYGLYAEDTRIEFEFGSIMAYIEDRALPTDLIVMTQPDLQPLVDYYSDQELAVAYVPAHAGAASAETVGQQMRSAVNQRSRVWLGPLGAWTADPESLVEQWLATHVFQAHKEWFPGSGSAALYFMPDILEPMAIEPGIDWEGRVGLRSALSSPPVVAPGDALLLAFSWEAGQAMDSPHLVSLHLVDEAGQVWAERQSEPCAGWCPTDTWQPGSIHEDRHALLVPPGTPPGPYRLQVSWYAPAEGRELSVADGAQQVDLGEVQVVRGRQSGIDALPAPVSGDPLDVEFGEEIVLLGFDLPRRALPAGEAMALELHWLARSAPQSDYTLLLEVVGPDGQVVASWLRAPATATLATSDWQAGEYLRGVHRLSLPRDLAPNGYHLRLTLIDSDGEPLSVSGSRPRRALGGLIRWQSALDGESLVLTEVDVTEQPERSRNFDVPPITNPLSVKLGQQVELLGYDLETDSAVPGGRVDLTLYWRGRGATERPYKVFTHLGQDGVPFSQHDAPPGGGCCPTDTWVDGEVVVDRHTIPLGADLAPGTYRLTAGMYHEPTAERLPAFDAQGRELDGQQIFIAEVVVRPGSTPTPQPARSDVRYRLYLPIVEAGW